MCPGQRFLAPGPLALQCVQRDTAVWWIFTIHEGEAEFREAPSDADAPGGICPSGSVSAAPWWSLAMPVFLLPHQDLQLHLFHFYLFLLVPKLLFHVFPLGAWTCPGRDASESPPGLKCTFFPLLFKLRQTSPIPASLGAFPE